MQKKSVLGMLFLLVVAMGVAGQAEIIANGSFEEGDSFAYPGFANGGVIPSWTYSGAGIGIDSSSNSYLFNLIPGGHLAIPSGSRAAFFFGGGILSQTVDLVAGRIYMLSWYEALRPLYGADSVSRVVSVTNSSGTVIQSSSADVSNKDAYAFRTMAFSVEESGTYTVSFTGLGDTYLLDNVQLMDNGSHISSETISNGSFEAGDSFTGLGLVNGGVIPDWAYAIAMGIDSPSNSYIFDLCPGGHLNIPDGARAAFFYGGGILSQTVDLVAGRIYMLSWYEALRPLYGADSVSRVVSVTNSSGTVIQSSSADVSNKDAYAFRTMPFSVEESGTYTVSFTGIGDTYLLDNIKLANVKPMEVATLINGSFEDGDRFATPGCAWGGEIPGWIYSGCFGINPTLTGTCPYTLTLDIPSVRSLFVQLGGVISQPVALRSDFVECKLSWYEASRPGYPYPARTVSIINAGGTVIQSDTLTVSNSDVYVPRTLTFTVPEDGLYTVAFSSTYSGSSSDDYTLLLDKVTIDAIRVKAPVFSPGGKTISNPTSITITSNTSGASIYYTTDGSTPTSASLPYTGSVTVDDYVTLKAVAIANGYSSPVTSVTYIDVTKPERGKRWVKHHPFQINAVVEGFDRDISQYGDIGFSSYLATSMGVTGMPSNTFGAASEAGLGWHWFYRGSGELPLDNFLSKLSRFIELYPGCLGVNVGDESDPSEYPALAPLVAGVKANVPEVVTYHVLCDNPNNGTFRTNLDLAINTMNPDVIMFDQYPFNGGSTDSDFYENLAIVRERALAAGIPYWSWQQGHGWNQPPTYSLRQEPSESELRLQAFMSLAYGYSGLSYWTYAGTYAPYTNAILNSSGTLSPIGVALEGAIDEIKNVGEVTKNLTSTGIFYVTASGESRPTGTVAWTAQAGYPISSVTVASGAKGFVIGLFTDDDANKYFMVVNANHAAYTSAADTAATVTITFNSSVDQITLINRTTGESETVTLTNHTLSNYSLPGGTGDLFCLTVASEPIPGDANLDGMVDVGDLGILAANYGGSGKTWAKGDFNGDGLVDVGDLGILAAHYGSSNFSADYAQAFGTTVTEEDADAEVTGSSICGGLGLPLIAGLALMGLMLVKLEE